MEELVGQHVPTWPFSLKQCLPSEIASQQQPLRLGIIRNVLISPPPQTSYIRNSGGGAQQAKQTIQVILMKLESHFPKE